MIQIGTLVLVPQKGLALVFGNYGASVGVELLPSHRLVWIEERTLVPPEEPTEEEVAYG